MAGISVKLPMAYDDENGLSLNQTYKDMIKQNLRFLFLLNPGERLRYPDMGVGIESLLFEQNIEIVREQIVGRAYQQVDKWMPIVELQDVEIFGPEINNDPSTSNLITISVSYIIAPLGISDDLILKFNGSESSEGL